MPFEDVLPVVISEAKAQEFEYYPPNQVMGNSDVERMKTVENSVFLEYMSDAPNMPGYIQDNHVFLQRDTDGKIVAFILFKKVNEGLIKIEDVVVDPTIQKNGTGKKLIILVITIADRVKMAIVLAAPPHNQEYYSQFGFIALRQPPEYWEAKKDGVDLPILQVNMRREADSKPEKRVRSIRPFFAAPLDQINFNSDMNLIAKFAEYARSKTSWYYRYFGSAIKETALRATAQEMKIHVLPITQKRNIDERVLREIAVAILWNAMIVRDQKNDAPTDSGLAIYQLLKSDKPMAPFSLTEIQQLKKILPFDSTDYQSYRLLRTQVFGAHSFYSVDPDHPEHSPYMYFNRF